MPGPLGKLPMLSFVLASASTGRRDAKDCVGLASPRWLNVEHRDASTVRIGLPQGPLSAKHAILESATTS